MLVVSRPAFLALVMKSAAVVDLISLIYTQSVCFSKLFQAFRYVSNVLCASLAFFVCSKNFQFFSIGCFRRGAVVLGVPSGLIFRDAFLAMNDGVCLGFNCCIQYERAVESPARIDGWTAPGASRPDAVLSAVIRIPKDAFPDLYVIPFSVGYRTGCLAPSDTPWSAFSNIPKFAGPCAAQH